MKKQILLFILILLLIPIFISCEKEESIEESQYPFPLTQSAIDEVLAKNNIPWEYMNSYSSDYSSAYLYKIGETDATIGVSTYLGEDNEKGLFINQVFATKKYPTDDIDEFNKEISEKVTNIASTLYGNSKDTKKVLNKFFKEANNNKSKNHEKIIKVERIGDTHYSMSFAPCNENDYVLQSIKISNTKLYEKQITSTSSMYRERFGKPTIATVSMINEIIEKNKNLQNPIFINVVGSLDNIKSSWKLPKYYKNYTDDNILLNKDDNRVATLTDDTGSMKVFLLPNTFTNEELGEVRNHTMLLYTTDNPFCVILTSSK